MSALSVEDQTLVSSGFAGTIESKVGTSFNSVLSDGEELGLWFSCETPNSKSLLLLRTWGV